MRCGRCAALEFVQVHHLQAVACAGVIRLALGSAHRCTQGQTADAAHAVDSDFHGQSFDGSGNVNVRTLPCADDGLMTRASSLARMNDLKTSKKFHQFVTTRH
jgi:hypothetical protein